MGTLLGTPVVLPGRSMAQVVEKKVVGDTGFEPLTPTVCGKHRKKLMELQFFEQGLEAGMIAD